MQISKIFLTIFLCGFLLFGFLYVMKSIRYGKDKAVWEARTEELQSDIKDLELEAQTHYKSAMEWMEKAEEHAEEVVVLKDTLKEEKLAHARDLAKIETLAPDEVVSELCSLLKVDNTQIVLTEEGVVFSLPASRLVLSRVQSYEFFKNVESPRKDEIISLQGQEIQDLRKTITGFENTTAALYMDIDKWKEMYQGEHKLRLDCESGFNLFSTRNLMIGGVITAVVMSGLIFFSK